MDGEHYLLFHFGRELILEQENLVYNGGDCKMIFIGCNIKYSSLIIEPIE